VLNPCQARDFSCAQGHLGKTDTADATVLAEFAEERMRSPSSLPRSPLQEHLAKFFPGAKRQRRVE